MIGMSQWFGMNRTAFFTGASNVGKAGEFGSPFSPFAPEKSAADWRHGSKLP